VLARSEPWRMHDCIVFQTPTWTHPCTQVDQTFSRRSRVFGQHPAASEGGGRLQFRRTKRPSVVVPLHSENMLLTWQGVTIPQRHNLESSWHAARDVSVVIR